MKNFEANENIIAEIAFLAHEKFRKLYQEKNSGTRIKITTDDKWIKKHETNKADLAKLAYSDLPKDWQKSRWLGAKAAFDALLETKRANNPLDENFIEYASDIVHEEWLKHNRDIAEDEHNLSYENLSEDAKEKDRIFVRSAIEVYKSRK